MGYAVSSGTEAVQVAQKWLGTPYQWGGGHGGTVPIGTPVDCSGLVDQVFGISGNTGTQIGMGSPVAGISSAQPGDLVFFGPIAPGEPYHVGIYSGAGRMIDAPNTGSVVRYDNVSGFGQVDGVRRLVPPTVSGGSGGGTPVGVVYNYAQLEGIWIQAGGNPQAAAMAAAIAMAESGGNSQAQDNDSNGSVDRGLWQINSVHGTQSTFDVMGNARAAVAISNNGSNWSPWVSYQTGAYKQFLNPNVAPDMNAPINGTNAAGGSTATGSVSLISCSTWEWIFDPGGCAIGGGSINQLDPSSIASNIIKGLIQGVMNPMLQIVAGVMGISGGLILMVGGMFLMVKDTQTYQAVSGAKRQGENAMSWLAGPEAGAAVNTANVAKGGGRQSQQRQQQQRPPDTAEMLRAEAARYRGYAQAVDSYRRATK